MIWGKKGEGLVRSAFQTNETAYKKARIKECRNLKIVEGR